MISLTVNARYKNRSLTGVERFAFEVEKELGNRSGIEVSEINPEKELAGLRGHAWEQIVLPTKLKKGEVLFSPCNTGPVVVKDQFVVIHDAAVWDYPEGFSRSFGTLYRNLLPAVAKRSRWVGTVSEFSRQRLAQHLRMPEDEILVLGNATSSDFRPLENPAEQEAPRFFCVGSLDPRKNFSRLVEVWEGLRKQGELPEGTTLRIAGGVNSRNFSAIELEDSPSVKWLGRISDEELIAEYQAATAFIFPSLYEGFGLPPLEALACGCPVLLSNQASLPEVGGPEHEGAVIYFDPTDSESMASSIQKMLALSPEEISGLSNKAIERSQLFSWRAIADRIAEVL